MPYFLGDHIVLSRKKTIISMNLKKNLENWPSVKTSQPWFPQQHMLINYLSNINKATTVAVNWQSISTERKGLVLIPNFNYNKDAEECLLTNAGGGGGEWNQKNTIFLTSITNDPDRNHHWVPELPSERFRGSRVFTVSHIILQVTY